MSVSRALTALVLLAAATSRAPAFTVERVATGLEQPVYVTAPPDDTSRLFIVEANSGGSPSGPMIARIKILNLTGPNQGTVNATPFLTINGVQQVEDQGLFGLVFHPNYAENGFFYVNYAVGGGGGESRVERYRVSVDPDVADPASATLILKYPKPFFNHNGDWLGFNPWDLARGHYYLYHTTGDGGSNLDPGNRAQDTTLRYGKVLRVDVGADGLADDFPADPENNYAMPPDNPGFPEPTIWALGLRNPWRASFDRVRGDLYIGNVGANRSDEVEFQPYDSGGGENYGWNRLEGTCAGPNPGPPGPDDVFPMHECFHSPTPCATAAPFDDFTVCPRRSVTGGYVYRGPVLELIGHYVFADFLGTYNFGAGTGRAQIFSLQYDGSDPSTFDGTNVVGNQIVNRTSAFVPDAGDIEFVSSFGEDAAGNLYVVDMGNLGTPDGLGLGEVFRVNGASDGVVDLLFDSPAAIRWSANLAATRYDVVKGDLIQLLQSGGDFGASTLACIDDQSADLEAEETAGPAEGEAFFYLARAVNADGHGGTYDSASAAQVASRDGAIFWSGQGCP